MQRILNTDKSAIRDNCGNQTDTEKNFMTKGAWGTASHRAGSLSAYKLVISLLKLALGKGLNLQTEASVLRFGKFEEDQGRWIVQTPRGNIQAIMVLLATNGYTAHL